jgi:hypothetical protein
LLAKQFQLSVLQEGFMAKTVVLLGKREGLLVREEGFMAIHDKFLKPAKSFLVF